MLPCALSHVVLMDRLRRREPDRDHRRRRHDPPGPPARRSAGHPSHPPGRAARRLGLEPHSANRFAGLQRELAAQPRRVADGNYAATLPIRLAAADTVIFLDLPAWACLWGILQRRLRHRAGQHTAIGVYDRITWDFVRYILRYRRSMRPRILRLLAQDAGRTDLVLLRSRRATRRFLRKLLGAKHGLVPIDETTGSA